MLVPLHRPRQASLSLLLFAALACFAPAQDATPSTAARVDEILSVINRARSIGQVAVSPNGRSVAFVLAGEIRVAPLGQLALNFSSSHRITAAAAPAGPCTEGHLAWSPDSASLAFASDCAQPGEQTDLYLSHLDETPPTRLTHLEGAVDSPAFSPDGRSLDFLYVAGATRPAGALAAMKPPSGVIGEEGIEIQRVAQVMVPSSLNCEPSAAPGVSRASAPGAVRCLLGPVSFLSPAGLHVYEFDWSPDSNSIAYIAAEPPGENNWWIAKLYTESLVRHIEYQGQLVYRDLAGGVPHAILDPTVIPGPLQGLQIAVPRWSPDGKSIAFIGGLMSDQGATGGDVWMVPAEGGEPRDLTAEWMSSSEWIEWVDDHEIDVSGLKEGNSELVRLIFSINPASHQGGPPGGSTGRDLMSLIVFSIPGTAGDGRMDGGLSETADHSLTVFAASSFDRAPEIFAAPTGGGKNPAAIAAGFAGLTQLSDINGGVGAAWGKSVSLNWTNDNLHIQGWLLPPAHFDPAQKYPLIVEVHGGPSAMALSRWGEVFPFSPAVFSALGYFVFLPNPRGSFGQGEAFTQANRKDFGYGDLRDILAGVDTVLARYPIDPHRIALDGWSYGGFMTMFAVTQTHRFRAAVAGAGISDWLSYYGENSIGQWMIPFFGASVYDDPQVYAKSSAIDFIKNVSTPTLLLVGDRDGECPAPQSFEFWHALRDRHIPTQLVVYPNEGHGITDLAHRRDVLGRTVDWFARYLPPEPQ